MRAAESKRSVRRSVRRSALALAEELEVLEGVGATCPTVVNDDEPGPVPMEMIAGSLPVASWSALARARPRWVDHRGTVRRVVVFVGPDGRRVARLDVAAWEEPDVAAALMWGRPLDAVHVAEVEGQLAGFDGFLGAVDADQREREWLAAVGLRREAGAVTFDAEMPAGPRWLVAIGGRPLGWASMISIVGPMLLVGAYRFRGVGRIEVAS
jgi:hypothetical protein